MAELHDVSDAEAAEYEASLPPETRTLLSFAGCPPDGPDYRAACDHEHDQVIAKVLEVGGVPLGPVQFYTVDPEFAEEKLKETSLIDEPRAKELLQWLKEPDRVLLIVRLDFLPPRYDA